MAVQQTQQAKWKRLVEIFSKLNIYDSETTDPILLRKEILSTRLFIILFVTSLSIITVYASYSLQEKTQKVLLPTENDYRMILQAYPATLTCPCSKISIPFHEFAIISPVFHQVCASAFAAQQWIDFIFHPNRSIFWPMDIRNSLSSFWQIIRVFCDESRVTFDNSLQDFKDSSLISSTIVSPELLDTELQVSVNTLQQTAADSLLRPSKAIHILTKVDDLMAGLSTNFIAIGKALAPSNYFDAITTRTTTFKNIGANEFCACQGEESCPIPAGIYLFDTWETLGIYDLNEIMPNEIIPGIVLDCSPMQTVLESTLECFYNQTCLNILISTYPQNFTATALSFNIKSHFQSTDQIEKLIEAIFIEEILTQTNFTSYYHNCQPSYCVYTYAERFDWSYVLTTIISLFGGLNIALHLVCPYIIQLVFWCKKRASSNESHDETLLERVPLKVMVKRWILSIFENLVNLNLFTKKSRRPIQLHRGRISTRLYLVLFAVILTVLTLYTAISVRSITEITLMPSETQYKYLQRQYPSTLQCPCSVVSIPYRKMIEIHPSLHQICFSDFVKKSWYQNLGIIPVIDDHGNSTYSLSWYFRSLAAICDLSQLLLEQSVRRFNSFVYVSAKVTPTETFEPQMRNIISGFKLTTKNEFSYTIELIRAILHANGYISGIPFQNTILFLLDFAEALNRENLPTKVLSIDGFTLPEIGLCYCAREGDCYVPIGGRYNHFKTCSSLKTTMRLSLEDFYGTNFIEQFEELLNPEYIDLLRNASSLDPTKPTRFEINATLETIFEEMMIEDWNAVASFSRFYEICRPDSCSYSYEDRPTLIILITMVSGIVGGLNILLRLIISVMVRLIIRDPASSQTDSSTDTNQGASRFTEELQQIFGKLRRAIFSLNLFDDKPNIVDTKKKEVISTWLYLSLLILTVTIVAFYISMISYSSNAVVSISSLSAYETLLKLDLDSLRCPCTEISVPYKDFVLIEPSFHQVCDSDFVQQAWIYALFDNGDWFWYDIIDIRIRGAAYFGLLSSLCQLSKTTVLNALDQFLNEIFVNTYVLTENEFHSRIDASIDLFERNTPAEFATVLRVLNQLTHASTFVSTYMLNWEWEIPANETLHRLQTRPVVHNGCSCGTRNDCSRKAGIYSIVSRVLTQITPGFFVGCSSIATLLQSTLECFYQQSCINDFITDARETFMRTGMRVEVKALDPEITSQYKLNTTIKEMVELLFIEKWRESISYEAFYKKCAPVQCSYSYQERNHILYISTTILSIYGGATTILRLAVPHLVSQLTNFIYHRMSTVRPSA